MPRKERPSKLPRSAAGEVLRLSEPLEKMAKIHDDPKKPMHVWRVQNERGEGPYRYGWDPMDEMDQQRRETIEQAITEYPGVVPQLAPEEDFSYRSGLQINKPTRYYAFKSPTHALNWFSQEGLNKLAEAGFKLKRVPARRVWDARRGGKRVVEALGSESGIKETGQLIYEPWEAEE